MFEGFEDVSEEVLDLIQDMLTKDPKKRPSAAECLENAWFKTSSAPEEEPEQFLGYMDFNASAPNSQRPSM